MHRYNILILTHIDRVFGLQKQAHALSPKSQKS